MLQIVFTVVLTPLLNVVVDLDIVCRIETVFNSDRILVMEQGCIMEFAPPGELLNNHDSLFYSLSREYYST